MHRLKLQPTWHACATLMFLIGIPLIPSRSQAQTPKPSPAKEATAPRLSPPRSAARPNPHRQSREVSDGRPTPEKSSAAPLASLPASEHLRHAYEQAQQAKTIEQYSQILHTCEMALKDKSLTGEQRRYGQHLAAWLFNKRGEAYSAQAEELSADGDDKAEHALEKNALQDFERSVKLNPDAWRPLHNRGVSRAILKDFEGALDDFAAALERNPRYVNTWFNRAEVLYELGQYDKAVADYSQAIRLNPQDADAHANRGHAHFQLAEYQKSLEDYDRVLQFRPDDALAYVDRADAYAYLGEWSKAAADYRVAIRLDNQQPRAYQNAAWLMATCPAEEFRNPELAIRAAERAIALSGKSDHRSLDILAAAQASAGQFDEAQQMVQQAMHAAPADLKAPMQGRLELYKRQKPYRQPDRATDPADVGATNHPRPMATAEGTSPASATTSVPAQSR